MDFKKVGKHLSIQGISLTFPSLKKKRTLRHQELEGPKTLWDLEVKRHFLRKTQEFLTPPAFAGFVHKPQTTSLTTLSNSVGAGLSKFKIKVFFLSSTYNVSPSATLSSLGRFQRRPKRNKGAHGSIEWNMK
ncbi:hypothetical protein AcV7_002288 [Taiwanofungus camphoratus]|nr:hypothetical protein AcV7_002288 [Antrodia cinnamomea]